MSTIRVVNPMQVKSITWQIRLQGLGLKMAARDTVLQKSGPQKTAPKIVSQKQRNYSILTMVPCLVP